MENWRWKAENNWICVYYDPGGYDKEERAARAYDLAALKYWGPTATTNFPVIHSSLFNFLSPSFGMEMRIHELV